MVLIEVMVVVMGNKSCSDGSNIVVVMGVVM